MDEKPTAILKAEEVHDTPTTMANPETPVTPPVLTTPTSTPTPEPPHEDNWSKFPPQVDDMASGTSNKGGKGLLIFVIVLVFLAVGVVGFVVYKSNSMSKAPLVPEPTPTSGMTETIEPTATPAPGITDKSEVKIQILNGSGVVGQAGKIATALEKEDFKTPETANYDGDKQSDTTVSYTAAVDKSLVDEVVTVLKKTFTTVNATVSATLTDFDIQIVTGTDN